MADTVLEAGGKVIGVIPTMLEEKEISHPHLTELIVVHSMHERKAKMVELSDGFIALPGGMGTLEEFFEVLTWAQLGLHQKPCGILNIHNYYDLLISFLDHINEQQFLQDKFRSMVLVDSNPRPFNKTFKKYNHQPLRLILKKSKHKRKDSRFPSFFPQLHQCSNLTPQF